MKVYINDDFGDFYSATLPANEWNTDRLKKRIDFYTARGGVDAIFLNLNASRAFFDSRTRTPIWHDMTDTSEGVLYNGKLQSKFLSNAARNALALYTNVPDPMRFNYDYCHEKGVDLFISMRMNDIHFANDPDCIIHDDFWRNRPDRQRCPYRQAEWNCYTLDYSRSDVFEHNIELMEEYLDRFETDGLELDWMRTPPHVRPGAPDCGCSVLTEFMRRTRAAADKAEKRWNHPVKIAVRTPDSPENALAIGMDIALWVKEDLIDIIIPSPYFDSTCCDIPVKLWKLIAGEKVEVTPCLEIFSKMAREKSLPVTADIYIDCGYSAAFYADGADGIYMYNHFAGTGYTPQLTEPGMDYTNNGILTPPPEVYAEGKETQKEFNSIAGNYQEVCRRERRHIYTFNQDYFYESGRHNRSFLPANTSKAIIPFNLGIVGKSRRGRIVVGFRPGESAPLRVYCNTVQCELDSNAVFPYMPPMMDAITPVELYTYNIPADVLHDQRNTIEILSNLGMDYQWIELDLAPANQ